MRLQKYIALCGVCSRRRAEELISAGRITVNGRTASLGESVDALADTVSLDGTPLKPPEGYTYVMLHKPRGYVTTMRDPEGRPTVTELVRDAGVRLYPVGRLDFMSEGLLIMTDDGQTANRLAHPSHGVKKTYRVRVSGDTPKDAAAKLALGVSYKGVRYHGALVNVLSSSEHHAVLELTISEGKKREIRNMCAAVGLRVDRLVRVRQGELALGDLPAGEWRFLTEKEKAYLRSL